MPHSSDIVHSSDFGRAVFEESNDAILIVRPSDLRILDANPQIIFAADLMLDEYIGETILIPRSTESGGGR